MKANERRETKRTKEKEKKGGGRSQGERRRHAIKMLEKQ
jgi:hypothetical protein